VDGFVRTGATNVTEGLDDRIVRAAIHPAIGVARVGDSEEYLLAPEVEDPLPAASYKDAQGRIKREAARFRVYGYNAAGKVVRELTARDATICWQVHVANKKAAWYQFQIALDIPEAEAGLEPPSLRRNATFTGDRRSLAIDPGPRRIEGTDVSGSQYRFDTGWFVREDNKVYLGEVRTDSDGRLLFLGGHGKSASYDGRPAVTFANNDGWHDDVADGPVTAKVTLDGQDIPTDAAWVAVAPPNYAPLIKSVRTLYDLLYDAYILAGVLPRAPHPSFQHQILPILTRMCELEWVNNGFAIRYGWSASQNFLQPDYLRKLAAKPGKDDRYRGLRQQIFTTFRNLERDGVSPVPWPSIYGDAMALPPVSPRQHIMLTATQYRWLEQWAQGKFEADYDPHFTPCRNLEELSPAEQAAMLDRAALSFCLADAFHPGCEVTWPIRHTTMYSAPFRIRHRGPGETEPDYGNTLTPVAIRTLDGPLYAQGPGDLTRWMAVPWQTDTASCRSGYELGFGQRYDPYLPTFWPARVPNQVLTERDYRKVMDTGASTDERVAAFERRAVWDRVLSTNPKERINEMVTRFGELGIVEVRPGPTDGAPFPAVLMVESEIGFSDEDVPPLRNLITVHVPEAEVGGDAAAGAIAAAVARTDRPDEEVSAGYIDLVARFSRRRPG
jgi:hypothetical protein